ncbi:CHU large protein [Variovorax sp. WDL1]|nr:CHU large protein [Variovorax sp. WDL1]
MLTACGGGGSDNAAGGFAAASSDRSESSLQAVILSPIGGIPSSAPSGTSGSTTAPTSGIDLTPISGIPATAPSSPGTTPTPVPGIPLAPISGIPSTDPGVPWGPVLRTFGDPAFKLNGPSGISAPLVFYSSNTSVATISGSTVTIVGAGTSWITANMADPTAPQLVGANILLTVKKAQPNLSMPTVTLEAGRSTALLQASTKSPGAIQYALSNMMSISGAPVAFLESDGRTLTSFAAGTAIITATQVPSANYEGGTVSGNLVVEKRKSTISLADLTQPYTNKLVIPVSAETYDEISDELRTPTITLSNPAIGSASWDTDNYPSPSIVLNALKADTTSLTFSLGATANLAAVSKTVSVTLTSVTATQPGRQLATVEGHTIYKEDYSFKGNVVTLKLCPSMGEKIDFGFSESANNYGNAYVTLNGATLLRDNSNGHYVADIPAVATGDVPLKLRSVVDAASDGTVTLSASVIEYDVNVELFQNPLEVAKCYSDGGPR